MKNKEEISYEGIYDNNDKDMHRYQFMQNAESTQAMIDIAKANQIDPMVWVVHQTKKIGCIIIHYQFSARYGI